MPPFPPPGGVGGFVFPALTTSSILRIIDAASVADLIICSLLKLAQLFLWQAYLPPCLQGHLLHTIAFLDCELRQALPARPEETFLRFRLWLEVLTRVLLQTSELQAAPYLEGCSQNLSVSEQALPQGHLLLLQRLASQARPSPS